MRLPVPPRPDSDEVVARYKRMTAQTSGREMIRPIPPVAPDETEELSAEGFEEREDDGSGEPPKPLIEDETTLTEDYKNLLLNAVWYRCENPYCKYSRFPGVHHIVEEKDGGNNRLENLIVLCPFCHDLAHSNGIPEKEMRGWISNREERFKFKPDWPYN
jgi:hypothetical protein